MAVSKELAAASKAMAALSIAGALASPVLVIACFIFPDETRALDMHISHLGQPLTSAVPVFSRMLAMMAALVPTAATVWMLIALARLFGCFARNEIFSPASLRALSHVTAALFLIVLLGFVMEAPISYLLTIAHPPGHREISLELGSDDIETLFLAGAAFVVARVMAEARRIADENAKFV